MAETQPRTPLADLSPIITELSYKDRTEPGPDIFDAVNKLYYLADDTAKQIGRTDRLTAPFTPEEIIRSIDKAKYLSVEDLATLLSATPDDIEKVAKELGDPKKDLLATVTQLKEPERRLGLVTLCANEQASIKIRQSRLIINHGRSETTGPKIKKYEERLQNLAEIEKRLMTETSTPSEEVSRT